MSIETYISAVIALIREHRDLAEPAVFVLGFLESIPVISLAIPSSALFVGIGAAHGAAGSPLFHIWLAGAAGAFTGDCLIYLLGRRFEHRILGLWPLRHHPEWWQTGHAFFERWGMAGIVIGKFLGPIRSALPLIAGIVEMPAMRFVAASAVSCVLWSGAFLAPGSLAMGWAVG